MHACEVKELLLRGGCLCAETENTFRLACELIFDYITN